MGGYLAYTEYKDSGIEWLEKIPKHWSNDRLRFLLSENFANGIFKKRDSWGAGFRVVNVFDVYVENDVISEASLDRVECNQEEASKYSAKHGDFFFVRSSLKLEGIGKSATFLHPVEDAVFECHLVRGRPNLQRVEPKFLNYFLNAHLARSLLVSQANQVTMTTLDQSKFKDLPVSLPELPEQQQIAAFLDYKTAQIDALIAKKEALLEKLAEKRTALISQAVTKGLDPTVEMKDSGIEWLGEIPAHWDVLALKRLADIRGGVTKGRKLNSLDTIELPYLRVANVQDGHVDITEMATIEILKEELERYSLRVGDVLMNEGGDNDKLGRGAVWHGEIQPCLHQNHVFAVRPFSTTISDWIALISSSNYAKFYFFSKAKQSTNLASISATNIKSLPVAFPPAPEQKEILTYVSCQNREMDTAVGGISNAVEKLKEYRTALITNAVTGKIDVRDIKLPEPNRVEAT